MTLNWKLLEKPDLPCPAIDWDRFVGKSGEETLAELASCGLLVHLRVVAADGGHAFHIVAEKRGAYNAVVAITAEGRGASIAEAVNDMRGNIGRKATCLTGGSL